MSSSPRVNCLKAKNAEYINGYCLILSWKHRINFFDPLQKPTLDLFKHIIGLKITLVKFTSVPRAKLGVSLSLPLFFLGPTEFATLRLRGRPGRDGYQVHCGTVLRQAFSTWRQICQNSPTMHYDDLLDPVSRATSKWRIRHAHKCDSQSKQRAIRTLPNKRTTLRLLLFFIRWYLLIVRDY